MQKKKLKIIFYGNLFIINLKFTGLTYDRGQFIVIKFWNLMFEKIRGFLVCEAFS